MIEKNKIKLAVFKLAAKIVPNTTPKIIKALDGQKFIFIKRNNQKYILRLVSYISGDQLKDIKQKDISYFRIGSFIGDLASIMH